MRKKTILFTDSGLGGITIMADFIEKVKRENLPFGLDVIFFNAQKSLLEGYKVMTPDEQVDTFEKALISMRDRYDPDLQVIACNSLSVVYFRTQIHKELDMKVIDIARVAKELLSPGYDIPVLEIAMPTTVNSRLYSNDKRNLVSVASDIMLPNAIENNPDSEVTDLMLDKIFNKAQEEMEKSCIMGEKIKLFLGCTHFPIIKNKFIEFAGRYNFKVDEVINPNEALSNNVLAQLRSWKDDSEVLDRRKESIINIKVVSRTKFREMEVRNIAHLLDTISLQTATALRKYRLIPDLF